MSLRFIWFAAALLCAGEGQAATEPATEAQSGMVVSSQHLASEIGRDILKAGGNAVDAAVAVGYAEAVVNPCCGNIGGGGFMVLHLADGRERFINFREKAPAAATAAMYLDAQGAQIKDASQIGYKAVAVPGTVLGLDAALRHYGTMSRKDVMAPAIKLAREGYVLTTADADIFRFESNALRDDPVVARIFLRPGGTPLQAGDRLIQSDLAKTLQRISTEGTDAFYKGAVPAAIVKASNARGGIITEADFANYKIDDTDPLRCSYRGYVVVSAPPPSSGGATMCEILNILEGYDLASYGFHSAQSIHLTVEAMRHAYLDRNYFLGDPAFVQNPLDRLLSKTYAEKIRATIDPAKASSSEAVSLGTPPHEKAETTHFSVLDKNGNAVSATYTVNGAFGAKVMVPGTGFVLNDQMDDFTTKPDAPNMYGLIQGKTNAIAPGKRPLSSMAPTIVTKDGKPFLVLGSPGGSRIITITLETLMNVIDYGLPPQEAVDAPRFHHQYQPDEISVEPRAVSPDTAKLLEGMGYRLHEQRPWGAAELIAVAPSSVDEGPAGSGHDQAMSGDLRPGFIYGSNDDRRPAGAAVGY